LGWVGGVGLSERDWLFSWVVGAKGEVSTAAAHASERPLPVFLASPPSKACGTRAPYSSTLADIDMSTPVRVLAARRV